MPTIDEAVERSARAVLKITWQQECYNGITFDDMDSCRIGGPYDMGGRVEFYEAEAKTLAKAALSAFFADVPVSEGMRRKGANAFMDGGGDSRFADAYKAMSAKLAEEIQ